VLARWPCLSLLALSACVRDVENHCANQDAPDQYCAQIQSVGEFCSKCTAENFGCVAALAEIDADCRPDGATSVADDGNTDDSATVSTSAAADDAPMTSTSGADSTEGSTGPPQPVCGNEIIEDGEQCDGSIGDHDCDEFDHGNMGRLLCDPTTCEWDFTQCSSPEAFCGDRVVNETSEECDTDDFDLQDCDSIPGYGNGTGVLMCTATCDIDPSACCLDDGQACTEAAQCCNVLGCGAVSHECGLL
jgi:hypothetical protein